MKKILIAISFLALSLLFAVPALADCNNTTSAKEALQCGVSTGGGGTTQTPDAAAHQVNNILATVINVFSTVVGVIAVIMIIVAGFRYITSGGSQEKTKSAKDTIMYAIIGLVIVAMAQIIVQFVLDKATHQVPNCVNNAWDSGPNKGKKCTS